MRDPGAHEDGSWHWPEVVVLLLIGLAVLALSIGVIRG